MQSNKPVRGTFYNVKDYGVVGDGTTDDYAALTALVATAKTAGVSRLGAVVYFPPGKYMASQPIVLPRTTDTPTNVVHLVGDNARTSIIAGSATFPTARSVIEWEATTASAWHQRIANLSLWMPDVAGTKAIWHKANQSTINASTALNERLQLDLENILIECNNEFHQVCIDLEIGTSGCHWRNVTSDPTRGSGANAQQYATLLARTRYEYTSVSVTSITHSGTTATATKAGHGYISNQFVRVSGANQSAYNGTFRITVTSSSVFTYVMASDPGADATGTLVMFEQPKVGADSVGFWGKMECVYPLARRGGWCRLFEGRAYYTTFDTSFINGQRSGHSGNNFALYNSWTTKVQNFGFEGGGSDGSAICKVYRGEQVRFDSIHCPVGVPTDSAWSANHAYVVGDRVVPTALATAQIPTTNRYFACTTAGTSGGSEPTWGTPAQGATVADGTAVWTAQTPALGNSIEFSQSRGCKLTGRLAVNGNPLASGRLVKALSIDAECYDVVCEDFDINSGYPTVSTEVEVLAAAANGCYVRGRQIQAFSDVREPYQLGANDLLVGSATYDPPSLVDGAGASTTVTVYGATVGDFVEVSFSNNTFGMILTGEVSTSDTVAVRFQNETGSQIDLASGTLRARVRKAS